MHLPETTTALLVPARGPVRATRHEYVRTERVTIKSYHPEIPDGEAYAFIFRCSETGAERRWGLQTPGAGSRSVATPAVSAHAPALDTAGHVTEAS